MPLISVLTQLRERRSGNKSVEVNMYIIYDATTKEYINIVQTLPETMVPGRAYKEVLDDYDWKNSYIDDADVLQAKTALTYSFSTGVFSTTAIDDTLNIQVNKYDDVEMTIETHSFTIDLSTTTTLDLSAYIGYDFICTSKKYTTITDTVS